MEDREEQQWFLEATSEQLGSKRPEERIIIIAAAAILAGVFVFATTSARSPSVTVNVSVGANQPPLASPSVRQ